MQQIEINGDRIAVYTVHEAALVLGVHRHTIQRMGNAKRLTEYRTAGADRQRLYPKAEIDAIRDGRAESAAVFAMTPEEARAELARRGVTAE